MTNDPSTAITNSTAPAPEVSDGTSREGNVFHLPVTEGGSAPPAPDLVKKIGKTTYRVKVHFSETSKETMSDKIKRMLRNEISQMGVFQTELTLK